MVSAGLLLTEYKRKRSGPALRRPLHACPTGRRNRQQACLPLDLVSLLREQGCPDRELVYLVREQGCRDRELVYLGREQECQVPEEECQVLVQESNRSAPRSHRHIIQPLG